MRLINLITRPFRVLIAWYGNRKGWLSLSLRQEWQVFAAVDAFAEGRITEDEADARLMVWAEKQEKRG